MVGKNIHSTAIVDPSANIANDVEIGPYSIVHANVVLAEGCKIGSYCELGIETPLGDGSPLIIEKDSLIRSHSIFYESSRFGEKLVTGHRVTVRENTHAGKNLQLGTLNDIQGDCEIGDYVRFHSNVHVGKKSTVGDFVWIFPYVVLTNDPHPPSNILKGVTVGDYAIIATMSVILPGVKIGEGALIAAHSSLKVDAEAGMLYMGSPAEKICSASKIRLQDGTRRPAYPWINHFSRGYPESIVNAWGAQNDQQ
jgi:acyl-[acyl carrier protein]--UDP-N-acetylglucosamine O-acyltransferase